MSDTPTAATHHGMSPTALYHIFLVLCLTRDCNDDHYFTRLVVKQLTTTIVFYNLVMYINTLYLTIDI